MRNLHHIETKMNIVLQDKCVLGSQTFVVIARLNGKPLRNPFLLFLGFKFRSIPEDLVMMIEGTNVGISRIRIKVSFLHFSPFPQLLSPRYTAM
jgi:hypothetical protein